MKTLIIFLLLILILFVILSVFIKVKLRFTVEIDNFDIEYKLKIAFLKFNGKLKLEEKRVGKNKQNSLDIKSENITLEKTNEAIKNIKYEVKKYWMLINTIIEISEIKFLNTEVKVGLLLMNPTLIAVQGFSILIPILYNLPFKKKHNLKFKVLPIFDTFKFNLKMDGEVAFSLYSLLLFLVFYKKVKV